MENQHLKNMHIQALNNITISLSIPNMEASILLREQAFALLEEIHKQLHKAPPNKPKE